MPAKTQVSETGVFLQKADFEAAEAAFIASGGKPIKNEDGPKAARTSENSSKNNKKKGKGKKGQNDVKDVDKAADVNVCHVDSLIPSEDNVRSTSPNAVLASVVEPVVSPQTLEEVLSVTPTASASSSKKNRKKNKSKSEDEVKSSPLPVSSIVTDIKQVREQISQTLGGSSGAAGDKMLEKKFQALEVENKQLKNSVNDLVSRLTRLETRMSALEGGASQKSSGQSPAAKANGTAKPAHDDDDDIDLFGSDEDEAANAARDQRLKDYAEKKAKKPGPIAKSNVVLDVKPWDDETDMKAMEDAVRSIQMDGLVWGASKLVPLAFTIKKLQIVCVVEDDKVSIEELSEKIEEFEDFVQSVDVAAFNKI